MTWQHLAPILCQFSTFGTQKGRSWCRQELLQGVLKHVDLEGHVDIPNFLAVSSSMSYFHPLASRELGQPTGSGSPKPSPIRFPTKMRTNSPGWLGNSIWPTRTGQLVQRLKEFGSYGHGKHGKKQSLYSAFVAYFVGSRTEQTLVPEQWLPKKYCM